MKPYPEAHQRYLDAIPDHLLVVGTTVLFPDYPPIGRSYHYTPLGWMTPEEVDAAVEAQKNTA